MGETKRRPKDRFNEHPLVDLLTNKLTALSLPQYPNIFLCNNHNAADMQLISFDLVKSIRDSVRILSLKEGKPLVLISLERLMKLSKFLWY